MYLMPKNDPFRAPVVLFEKALAALHEAKTAGKSGHLEIREIRRVLEAEGVDLRQSTLPDVILSRVRALRRVLDDGRFCDLGQPSMRFESWVISKSLIAAAAEADLHLVDGRPEFDLSELHRIALGFESEGHDAS